MGAARRSVGTRGRHPSSAIASVRPRRRPDPCPVAREPAEPMIAPATATKDVHPHPEGAIAMATTQMVRVDAYGLLPSLLIVLMLILAILGVVAHAAVV